MEGKGYQVSAAGNGIVALQCVREQIPDIVFVDIMMPLMDGFDLISNLRENPETAEIPVVLVTALNPQEMKGRSRALGVKHHLTKPWEPWVLDCVLEMALKPSGRGR